MRAFSLHSNRSQIPCLLLLMTLAQCLSVSAEENLGYLNGELTGLTDAKLVFASSPEQDKQNIQVTTHVLSAIVGRKEAIHLALANSATLQALFAQGLAETAATAQNGRIAHPLLSLERMRGATTWDMTQSLSLNLFELLSLPARQAIAKRHIETARLRMSGEVIEHLTLTDQAWVRAVAAQQMLAYTQQVFASAEAGAELARRMATVGNLNRLNHAREHVFYAEAASRLAIAQQQVTSTREALARLLGLNETQAAGLRLPDRLPELPTQAVEPGAAVAMAHKSRLDIRLAQAELNAALTAQGLGKLAALTDIELTARQAAHQERGSESRTYTRGYTVDIQLPLFNWAGMARESWNARTRAAAHHLDATLRAAGSQLRASYVAYRTAYDIARHHRKEIVPLHKIISEENQRRYNGMFIGIFELLADTREQINAVQAAIRGEEQFWLAQASFQASLMGAPSQSFAPQRWEQNVEMASQMSH